MKRWEWAMVTLIPLVALCVVAYAAWDILDALSGRRRPTICHEAKYDGFTAYSSGENVKFVLLMVTHPSSAAKDFEITMPDDSVVSLADIEHDNTLIPSEVLHRRPGEIGVRFHIDPFKNRLDYTAFDFAGSSAALPVSFKGKRFEMPMTQAEMEHVFGTEYRLETKKEFRGPPW